MKRLKKLKKAAGVDTKFLAVGAVLVLAALYVVFGGGLPSYESDGTSQPATTTTMAQPATTTTLAETEEEAEEEEEEVTGDDCSSICLAADYSSGQCRPGCLSYEDRADTIGSDCSDIQKCCCK